MEGEGEQPGRRDAPGSPRRARSTTPEQRAALRKQKEERQRRARRRQQGLPDEPAPAPAQPDLDAIIQQAEAERAREAEKEAAAATRAEEERQKAAQEEELQAAEAAAAAAVVAAAEAAAAAKAAKAAEERTAAEQAAAETKRLADEEAAAPAPAPAAAAADAAAAAAVAAEAKAGAPHAATKTEAEPPSPVAAAAGMQAAETSHTEGRDSASPALVVLNVSKGSAGFTCTENLTVVKLPAGKKGSQAEAAGVTVGMRCVAFQGVPLDSTATWSSLKEQVKAAPKPWSFTFSPGADEADSMTDPLPVAEPAQSAHTHDEEPVSCNQQGVTIEMTSVTLSMIEEGWQQPAWVSSSRDTPSAKPSTPSKPAELPGVEPGSDYVVVAWTMPSGEALALDFDVQVTKKRGSSMVVVAREDLSVNHNDRWMVRELRTRLATTASVY